jgi:hypothetical protein
MAFRAVHPQWGPVFAHLPDLGCGQAWEAVWKARPPAPLTCDECQHPMHAKVSRNGLRFFAHAPHAPNCALALETLAHHVLKLELANAARDVGAHAEMEARGPGGSWRADVLASDPGGIWRMALEAQLAPITGVDIAARTERMRADGVTSIWFSDRPKPPWLGVVPSVRLARADDGQDLVVAEGLVKFDGYWQAVPAALAEFLGWAFTGRVVPYRPRFGPEGLAVVWTAPRYIQAFDEYVAELERQAERAQRANEAAAAAAQRAKKSRQEEIRRKNAISRAKAQSDAVAAEQAAQGAETGASRREWGTQRPEVKQAVAMLARKYGITAIVGWSTGDPRYAGGIPLIDSDGALAAVFNPVARRVRGDAFLLLAGTLLLFPSKGSQDRFEYLMKKASRRPADGWRTDFIGARSCACVAPQLVVMLLRREYRAEPSETPAPSALGHAECRGCGRWYFGPWRMVSRALPAWRRCPLLSLSGVF